MKINIMGASESREPSHDHLKEDVNTTPVHNRRILKLQDPRSPTAEIHRTPLVTDTSDFEDPRSPTAEICRTPVAETSDPRSPTEGIPRTPANPFIFPDPRSPSVGVTRTPLIKSIPENTNVATSENESKSEMDRTNRNEMGDSVKETINNNSNSSVDTTLKNEENSRTDQGGDETATKDSAMEQINTPQFEVELANLKLDESNANEVLDESQSCATLVLSDSEPRLKYRGSAAKRSLKEKFQAPSSQQARSPLSSRNLHQNAQSYNDSSPYLISGKHTHGVSRPTRLVGRYGPASMDKENV